MRRRAEILAASEHRHGHLRLAEVHLPHPRPRGCHDRIALPGPGGGHGEGLVRRRPGRRLARPSCRAAIPRSATVPIIQGPRAAPLARGDGQPRHRRGRASRSSGGLERQPHPLAACTLSARQITVPPLSELRRLARGRTAEARCGCSLSARSTGCVVVVDLHSPPGGRPPGSRLFAGSDAGLFTDSRLPAEVRRGLAEDGDAVQGRQDHLGIRPGQRAGRVDSADEDLRRLAGPGRAGRAGHPRDRPGPHDHRRAAGLGQSPGAARSSAAGRAQRRLQRSHVPARTRSRTRACLGHRRRSTATPARSTASDGTRPRWKRSLAPAVEFQRSDGTSTIYIGEFSAIRWAPDDSARRYLTDCHRHLRGSTAGTGATTPSASGTAGASSTGRSRPTADRRHSRRIGRDC